MERKLSLGDWLLNPIVKRIRKPIKPNHLSLARIPITFLVVVFLAFDWNILGVSFLSLAVFLDLIDGPLARWRGEQSSVGEWLDPLADKVMVIGILLFYGWTHFPPELIVATAIVEMMLIFGRRIKTRLGKNAKANSWGKIKVWFQSAAVIGLTAHTDWTIAVANAALRVALVFAGLSVIFHIRDISRRTRRSSE